MYDLKSWARNEKGWGTAAARQKDDMRITSQR